MTTAGLILGPILALIRVGQYERAHTTKHRRTRHEDALGKWKNCLEAIFVGHPASRPKTPAQKRAHDIDYEERLLREPFSVLYAMNEESTWWWFMIDIARKVLIAVIFACRNWQGRGFEWEACLLIIFVFFGT